MSKAKVYNMRGEVVGEEALDPDIFGVEVKAGLIHQVLVAQMANKRQVLAHTKDRGEVRGGGKKPWKQKGTGRARQGSIRSPLWVGGGIVFGPTKERVFKQKINKKMKRKALLMCLSERAGEEKIILVEKLEMDGIKTKRFVEILNNLPNKKQKTLLILDKDNKNIVKSAANLPQIKTTETDNLNVGDILNHNCLLIPVSAFHNLVKHLKSWKEKK
jgi:large subunit ribosomal protein L4